MLFSSTSTSGSSSGIGALRRLPLFSSLSGSASIIGRSGFGAAAAAGRASFATVTERKALANPDLKFWRPTSPGQRFRVTVRRDALWRGRPKRCLARGAAKTGGRNHHGRITARHRGGGARKVLRRVDFLRRPLVGRRATSAAGGGAGDSSGAAATEPLLPGLAGRRDGVVERLEYDPGRTAWIALVSHKPALEGAARAREGRVRALAARAAALREAEAKAAAAAGGRAAAEAAAGEQPETSSSSSPSSSSSDGPSDEYLAAVRSLVAELTRDRAAARRGGAAAAPPGARRSGGAGSGAAPGEYSYILAPQGLAPGDAVAAGPGAPVRAGNVLRLRDIPLGAAIHAIELRPGQGAQLCRAAGCSASIVNKQESHATVRLPSGEERVLPLDCRAAVGAVSNPHHKSRVIGKAGLSRHLGRRPRVRGVAMNAIDHPHGGSTQGRPSVTPWGIPCKGYRTRRYSPMAKWVAAPRPRGKGAAKSSGGGGGGA